MLVNAPYDSRNTFYRNPMGAVEQDTPIHFRIMLPRSLRCTKAYLTVKFDKSNDWEYINMFWCGEFGDDSEVWECHFTPNKIGLYWHCFKMYTNEGVRCITPAGPRLKSQISNAPAASWQITCYDKNFKTPDWPVGGVMYQIFPDRFNFSGEEKQGVPEDRKIHKSWDEIPDWMANENGEITNTDFFKGDLKGIIQKLDYLEDLGVTCIYLNPIFESHSNHRYDTANYSNIDPMLGTEEDFKELCAEAKKRGIRIINDGVFSHTGADSIYFNRKNRYNTVGAYNSQQSPYYSWYNFSHWPNNYHSWWGFYTLPEVNETDPNFNEYINGENGIVRKWMRCGNSGWRLDVADELPDAFLENLRSAVKAENPEALVIGEVWEDASNKESYGGRRSFLLGSQLDSVMNYVFRNAILGYLQGADASDTMEIIMSVVENYPAPVLRVLMNLLSTHDTERVLTVIAGEPLNGRGREWQANTKLSEEQRLRGIQLMKIAVGMLFTLPGFPCIYYGDEAGMEGYKDPFNRGCFPWGKENKELIAWHRDLAALRKRCTALHNGAMLDAFSHGRQISYIRHDDKTALFCAFNAESKDVAIDIPPGYSMGSPIMGTRLEDGKLYIPAFGCAFLEI